MYAQFLKPLTEIQTPKSLLMHIEMGPSLCCASVNFLSLGALFFHRNQISLLFSWVAAAELN